MRTKISFSYPDGMGDDLYYTRGDKNQLDVTCHPQSYNKRKVALFFILLYTTNNCIAFFMAYSKS